MCRTAKWLSFVILFSALFAPRLAAQTTINAASCNESDVAAAVSQATTDGDIVSIPSGTCVWTSPLSVAQTNSITIQGAGAVTPSSSCTFVPGQDCTTSQGTDQTILEDETNHNAPGDPAMLGIVTASGKSFRLTNLSVQFESSNTTVAYHGMVGISGYSQAVRIDHIHFVLGGESGEQINFGGWVYGVVDHCQFDEGFGNDIMFQEGGWNNDPYGLGAASWADSDYFGSNKFIFAEDNVFNGSFIDDCVAGGRYVLRYNSFNGSYLQTHGLTPNNWRGCRSMEVYNNTMVYSSNPTATNWFASIMLESGTGMFWGNTLTGYIKIVDSDTPRTNNATYSETATPNGWGFCGTALGPSSWDENSDSTGYACMDQVGRGKGDMVNGSDFPNFVDALLGDITWPHQALDPVYVWDNTYNAVPDESTDAIWGNTPTVVTIENRDYYLSLPNYSESATFNGTAGIGSGSTTPTTSGAYPNAPNCTAGPGGNTPGVGYWDTSNNTLYVCTATNTWTAYYTPYTYPHPLDTSNSDPPAPPTDLSATPH
jgi:hypothetical protein